MASQLRVLLDASAMPAARGGAGRYVEQLAGALDRDVDLSIVCQARDADDLSARAPRSQVVQLSRRLVSRPARLAWEQTGLPRLARRLKVDVLHSPHYTMPLLSPVPVVVTVHDATFFSDKHLHRDIKGRFFRGWTRVSLRRAAACVVPSHATAAELRRFVTKPTAPLTVAHHGVDPVEFHPPTPDEKTAAASNLGVSGTWIAFLGTLEPRKNVPALVRGYASAFAGHLDPPALVLVGANGWDPQVDVAAAAVSEPLRVLRPGFVPGHLLSGILGGSQVVAYPSLGEGFGLPVLEGMASGAAVLTTRELALPEVGGDAVAYCGTSSAEIGEALADLVADPVRRAELAGRALARAAEFSWQACAAQHLKAYEKAAAAGKSRLR
ncbi:MAG: glycosyltransferase family 4 protein [Actinomycetota bacterium]|nr:glycosyltransferase family 4 protein [Actinomycetota bacterium]